MSFAQWQLVFVVNENHDSRPSFVIQITTSLNGTISNIGNNSSNGVNTLNINSNRSINRSINNNLKQGKVKKEWDAMKGAKGKWMEFEGWLMSVTVYGFHLPRRCQEWEWRQNILVSSHWFILTFRWKEEETNERTKIPTTSITITTTADLQNATQPFVSFSRRLLIIGRHITTRHITSRHDRKEN